MIRIIVALLAAIFSTAAFAGEAKLEKLWQTEAVLKVPESVLFDAERKLLFVSNVEGENPWADDGKGSIAKIGLDGHVIAAEWVTGLNGPKGMGLNGNRLYVTDIDDVVTIDIDKGEIVDRLPVPGAGMINDLSVAADGTIYVTDSQHGRIHKLINGAFTTVVDGLTGLNGVLHSQGELLFVADGGLYVLGNDGQQNKIADGMEGHVDGVERIDDDSWLVSCWLGTVYHVTRNGDVTLLLDGRPEEISAADLGYDPVNKIAYFPGFWKNIVAAYRLTVE
jgi:outer membrane protein assembly factor BamB